jgi:hypothetical protein
MSESKDNRFNGFLLLANHAKPLETVQAIFLRPYQTG